MMTITTVPEFIDATPCDERKASRVLRSGFRVVWLGGSRPPVRVAPVVLLLICRLPVMPRPSTALCEWQPWPGRSSYGTRSTGPWPAGGPRSHDVVAWCGADHATQ